MVNTIHWYEHRAKKNAKNDFEGKVFNLMNNAIFGTTMENVKKHKYMKLVTVKARRNYLVSESKYQTTKFFL